MWFNKTFILTLTCISFVVCSCNISDKNEGVRYHEQEIARLKAEYNLVYARKYLKNKNKESEERNLKKMEGIRVLLTDYLEATELKIGGLKEDDRYNVSSVKKMLVDAPSADSLFNLLFTFFQAAS